MFDDKCILVQFTIHKGIGTEGEYDALKRRNKLRNRLLQLGATAVDESCYCFSAGSITPQLLELEVLGIVGDGDWYEIGGYIRVSGRTRAPARRVNTGNMEPRRVPIG